MSEISVLLGRMAGHTVSYRIEVMSAWLVGEWDVVERDGEIIEAEYVGNPGPPEDLGYSLTEALRVAAGADEVEIVVDRGGMRGRLQVDEDVDSIDDEFGLTATDITIEN